MTLEELDKNKYAALSVIDLADELTKKLETNNQVILERKISVDVAGKLTNEITTVLRHIINEIHNDEDATTKIAKISDIVSSLVTSLESSMRLSREDLVRLESTQEGMHRALEAVKSAGQIRMQELEKMESTKSSYVDASLDSSVTGRSKKKIVSEGRGS